MSLENDYSLDDFKVNQDFSTSPVQKQIVTVPVTKPGKSIFFRVHPDEKYRATVYTFEVADSLGKELYIVTNKVSGQVLAEFPSHMRLQTISTCVSRHGDVFLWAIPQPTPDKDMQWWSSAREAAKLAIDAWIRIEANQGIGAYDVSMAKGNLPDPVFPGEDFESLLRKGFKGKIIDNLEHEALNKLRGEF